MSSDSPITDPAELLHRQVPGFNGFVDDGKPTSLAFKPLDKDGGRNLSVDRDSVHTAEQSYKAFVAAGGQSDGVWSVNVKECAELNLPAFHTAKTSNPAHSTIDFGAFDTDKKRRKQAGKLAELAIRRGCQWRPASVQIASPSPAAKQEAAPASPAAAQARAETARDRQA